MPLPSSSAFPDHREKIRNFRESSLAYKAIADERQAALDHEELVKQQSGTWNPFKKKAEHKSKPVGARQAQSFERAQRNATARAELLFTERSETGPAIWRTAFTLLKAIGSTPAALVTWDLTPWSDFRDSLKPFNQAQRRATASREAWDIEHTEAVKAHKVAGSALLRVVYEEVRSVYSRAIEGYAEQQRMLFSAVACGDGLAQSEHNARRNTMRIALEALHSALKDFDAPLEHLSKTAAESVGKHLPSDVQDHQLLRGMPDFVKDLVPGLDYPDLAPGSKYSAEDGINWQRMSFGLAALSESQFDDTLSRIWSTIKHAHMLMTAEENLQAFMKDLNPGADPAFFQVGVKWSILSLRNDFKGQTIRIACDQAPCDDIPLVHRPLSSIRNAVKEVGVMLCILEAEALINDSKNSSINETIDTLSRIKSQLSKLSFLNNEDGKAPTARILWTSHPTKHSLSLLSDDLERQLNGTSTDADLKLSLNHDALAFHR